MKKIGAIVVIGLCALLFIYHGNGQTIDIRSYVPDESLDEAQIVKEVDESLSQLVTGIVERDTALIFGIFSDNVQARYVRDGAIYDSIATAEKKYERGFAEQDHSVRRIFGFQSKEYDIISPTTVLFTGVAESSFDDPDVERESRVIAYTILWLRTPEGWKAINMHVSWR